MKPRRKELGTANSIGAKVVALRKKRGMKQKELLAQNRSLEDYALADTEEDRKIEQAGDAVAYLLATEDQPLKGDLIVLRLAVRAAFQGQGYGSILIAALKDLVVQKEKEAIWIDCPEDLLSYFSQQGFRDEAESDRGVHMVWER